MATINAYGEKDCHRRARGLRKQKVSVIKRDQRTIIHTLED